MNRVFWTRAENDDSFLNPEIGAGCVLAHGATRFNTGYFNNGLWEPITPGTVYGYNFNPSNYWANNDRGTVEGWIKTPSTFSAQGLYINFLTDLYSGGWPANGSAWYISSQTAGFKIFCEYRISGIPQFTYSNTGITTDTWYHAAMCWDRSGIDGGSDTCRMYWDGVDVASTGTAIPAKSFVNSTNGGAIANYWPSINEANNTGNLRGMVDDWVFWDEAKTDYSDRFIEGRVIGPTSNYILFGKGF